MTPVYYSWENLDSTYQGLARHTDDGWAAVVQSANGWAVQPELIELILDGDMAFTVIDQPTASGLARQYGVTLDQVPEWRWDASNGQFVSLADGTPAPALANDLI